MVIKRLAVIFMTVASLLAMTAGPAAAEDLASLLNRTVGCDGYKIFCPGPMP